MTRSASLSLFNVATSFPTGVVPDLIPPAKPASCREIARLRRDRHATKTIYYPCVVAEVLSPGTRARDKGMKVDLYQNMPSIQEILFIDTAIMRIQLYRRETDYWIMRNFTNDERVELTSLGVSFLVREVYEKTTFDKSFAEE